MQEIILVIYDDGTVLVDQKEGEPKVKVHLMDYDRQVSVRNIAVRVDTQQFIETMGSIEDHEKGNEWRNDYVRKYGTV